MKNNLVKISIATLLIATHSHLAWPQGLLNYDFENPILPLSPTFNTVLATNAIPNWTAYNNGNAQTLIYYDTISLGGGNRCVRG
jgi:hypothetical protein